MVLQAGVHLYTPFCFRFRSLIIKGPKQTFRTGRTWNSEAKTKAK
jgi:hypothetical protein